MDWIIGDIHGYLAELKSLIAKVQEKDAFPRLIFLGDYIDRGPDSAGVIDYLIELKKLVPCVFIRGNHDDIFAHLIGLRSYTPFAEYTTSAAFSNVKRWFMQHGLSQTITSYGDRIREIDDSRYDVPPSHIEFFDNLVMFHMEKKFFCCHARFPSIALPREEKFLRSENYHCLLWGRYNHETILSDFGHDKYVSSWDGRMGIFGHTPVQYYDHARRNPILLPQIKLIDTGSFLEGGGITAFQPDTGLYFLSNIQSVGKDIL